MIDTICKLYVGELAKRIIEKFGVATTPENILKMWDDVLTTAKININFEENKSIKPKDGKVMEKVVIAEKDVKVMEKVVMTEKNKEIDTCPQILSSGKRVGSECGKKCVKGSLTCSAHVKKTQVEDKTSKEEKTKEKPKEKSKETFKLVVKERENGLLVSINETPHGSFFVFNNKKDRMICGKYTPDEKVIELDKDDKQFCKENGYKLAPVITKKSDIEDVLDDMTDITV